VNGNGPVEPRHHERAHVRADAAVSSDAAGVRSSSRAAVSLAKVENRSHYDGESLTFVPSVRKVTSPVKEEPVRERKVMEAYNTGMEGASAKSVLSVDAPAPAASTPAKATFRSSTAVAQTSGTQVRAVIAPELAPAVAPSPSRRILGTAMDSSSFKNSAMSGPGPAPSTDRPTSAAYAKRYAAGSMSDVLGGGAAAREAPVRPVSARLRPQQEVAGKIGASPDGKRQSSVTRTVTTTFGQASQGPKMDHRPSYQMSTRLW
jgi:hypothetical protein